MGANNVRAFGIDKQIIKCLQLHSKLVILNF